MRVKGLSFLAAALLLGGCYHVTVETGAAPSTYTVEESFASGWVFGLVAPSTVKTASTCKSGVAKVETWHSFVNMLVQGITFGIYTPMSIKVTCAQAGTRNAFVVPSGAGADQQQAIVDAAAARAITTGAPVNVQFAR